MRAAIVLSVFSGALGQQVGLNKPEIHPPLPIQSCSAAGSCILESTSVVLDANWRWTHEAAGYTNCYTGNNWNSTICSDPKTCAIQCALEGADYPGTYGIRASDFTLELGFKVGNNVGSRTYLLENESSYKIFMLKNREFVVDVDVSNLPCGINGAL